ncbi:MAG: RnfABCDGE type electron transport complex subunit D [Bacteroidales bacterium]|nr:RnfABCDGE type electron transport complex subunit D [Bacteroidales bacterium]
MDLLHVSGSPHVHSNESVSKIMWTVVIALLPTFAVSIASFGFDAVRLTLISIASCVLLEALIQKFLLNKPVSVTDGSAVVTGMLLAFNVPSNLPWWIMVIGAVVAIGVAKMPFGGLGNNLFNPALVGRVTLLISFPQQMTSWPTPNHWLTRQAVDATTGATPLGMVKTGLSQGKDMSELINQLPSYAQMLLGEQGGSLGEVAAIAILIGGLIMLFRKVISWHIPVAFVATAWVFATLLHLANPALFIPGSYHILCGGLLLGAVFMATDMVTSPMSAWGKIVFGCGCGLLTIIIRVWGAYPEGVSFAILLMNAVVPLLNKGFPPKRFGTKTM